MYWFKLSTIATIAATVAITAAAPNGLGTFVELYGNCPVDHSLAARDLSEGLSDCSEVYYPDSTGFDMVLLRWSAYKNPKANIVVIPCAEKDVAAAVKYANKQNLPFLAVDTTHGTLITLANMQSGVQISLQKLSSVKISKDGKSAVIGGGTTSRRIIDILWAAGKQTVTGFNDCVSYMGPGLGGGHGPLQGRHGLTSDQYISLNVVLADGTLKTITAKDDLFWGMKGAGHNFGIVTSVTSKIYDIRYRDWAMTAFIFKHDKVEAVYEAINSRFIDGNQPAEIIHWSSWGYNTTVDTKYPVLSLQVQQEGTKSVDQVWLKQLLELGPVDVQNLTTTYNNLSLFVGATENSPACLKTGRNIQRFSVYLERYNATAQKQAFDLFAKTTSGDSPLNRAFCFFEGYSMPGVRAAGLDASAFAYRETNILTLASINYVPAGQDVDEKATEFGRGFRDILYKGSGHKARRVYVNYGFGDESAKDWYGDQEWRQERLRSLKKKYDPQGKFSFYGPIPKH